MYYLLKKNLVSHVIRWRKNPKTTFYNILRIIDKGARFRFWDRCPRAHGRTKNLATNKNAKYTNILI